MAVSRGSQVSENIVRRKEYLTGASVSTPATDATTSVPPATPAAVMTMAMMTRRRPPRIHDDDLSFLNHFIQAARDARIEGHRLNRGRGQSKTCCRSHGAAQNLHPAIVGVLSFSSVDFSSCRNEASSWRRAGYPTSLALRRAYSCSEIDPVDFNRSSLAISSAALKPTICRNSPLASLARA